LSSFLSSEETEEGIDLMETIRRVISRIVEDQNQWKAIEHQFELTIKAAESSSINDLVRAIEVSREDIEQEVDEGKVNILTMHKAKGLTAEAVIIVAAEDEYLPGRAKGDAIGDERRLLYVSLTRAKHYLFITYCNQRTGPQRHTGRTSGQTRRSLTRFLQDAPIAPQPGQAYLQNLEGRAHDYNTRPRA
ncbi:MAG: ATP-binding domain-containing protein, partial [Acidobacteria bacterium]|nr:ATP-binding domain-containing protein [Acidobacteriota bacterium]